MVIFLFEVRTEYVNIIGKNFFPKVKLSFLLFVEVANY
jgi:hypothetical protein